MFDKTEHLSTVSPKQAARCRQVAKLIIPLMRDIAYRCGYALTTHGSMKRDIDVVCIPWRVSPIDPASLAEELFKVCQAYSSLATFNNGHPITDEVKAGSPGKKLHGRLTWTLGLGSGIPYVDLSVMPPKE